MVISETHFICDGCGKKETRKGTAVYEQPKGKGGLPDGWHYMQATRDGARMFVKLACDDCFGKTLAIFPKPWGTNGEGRGSDEY